MMVILHSVNSDWLFKSRELGVDWFILGTNEIATSVEPNKWIFLAIYFLSLLMRCMHWLHFTSMFKIESWSQGVPTSLLKYLPCVMF